MPISVNCPACNQAYMLADSQAGKRVRCKNCSEAFVVPAAPEEISDVVAIEEVPSARPRRRDPDRDDRGRYDEDDDARPRRRDSDRDEGGRYYEDDRPRRRRPPPLPRGGTPVWVWFAVGGGVLLLLIAVGLVLWLSVGPSKFSKENFEKLRVGMTESEVRAILGSPTEVVDPSNLLNQNPAFKQFPIPHVNNLLGTVKVLVWRRGNNIVQVMLLNDRVTSLNGFFSS
jgi:predicted Zn finger-like uncharacterized protein